MRPMTPISQRPARNTSGLQAAAAVGVKPATTVQALPPGFQPIHVKGTLPGSVLQRLAARTPRLHLGEQRGTAQALIDQHLTTGGGMTPRNSLRV